MALLISPLRQGILRALCDEELSAAQLARRLESPPSNLYYHLDRLLKADLIVVARSVPRRGMMERYFKAVAEGFSLGEETLRFLPQAREADADLLKTIRSAWSDIEGAFRDSLQAGLLGQGGGAEIPVVNFCRIRASVEELRELSRVLVDWMERCRHSHRSSGEAEYALFNMFFPTDLPNRNAAQSKG